MKSALIGHTGFVGGNLKVQRPFDLYYNSKNSNEMKGQDYSEVFCAGISAVKWLANKEPEKDKKTIQELQNILSEISAERFILISTIDVYPVLHGVDEDYDCHSIDNNPYGTHRLEFEDFCISHFDNCNIIRLPGLFGNGLKKNVIYDLLYKNCLDVINTKSSFQYYNLDNLWEDIKKIIKENIDIANLFTEPVKTQTIIDKFFPEIDVGKNASSEVHYDLHTKYSYLWNNEDIPYIYNRDIVLSQIEEFINKYKKEKNI